MAATTLTYTENMSGPIRAAHVGVNSITFDINSGASAFGTVSDVYLLGKIPNGAVVIGGNLNFGAQKNAAETFTLLLLSDEGSGTFSTYATLSASQGSITANATTAQRYTITSLQKVSYSDDRAIKYATLALNCTVGASTTTSFSFQGVINYVTDGRST